MSNPTTAGPIPMTLTWERDVIMIPDNQKAAQMLREIIDDTETPGWIAHRLIAVAEMLDPQMPGPPAGVENQHER